jgi:hypothetical protein
VALWRIVIFLSTIAMGALTHHGPNNMNIEIGRSDEKSLEKIYKNLIDLWTAGVRDYNSLLSDYLTANSIFVAAIGFLLARQPNTLLFVTLVVILCSFGILMALQMAIVLGRYSAQTALWEWRLRGIERSKSWTQPKLFVDLHRLRDLHETLEDQNNDPPGLAPNRAIRQHRQWWARREISFPLFFGIAYVFFLFWGLQELLR